MDFGKFRDTAELADITVCVDGRDFRLHRFPLYVRSDFFRALARNSLATDGERVELADFPGGADTFELVTSFCYNIDVDVTPKNVCQLRCAAEFLQMTSADNLASAADRYLTEILTSAKLGRDVATIVDLLLQCSSLGPIAEQAGVAERCMNAVVDSWLVSTKFTRKLQPQLSDRMGVVHDSGSERELHKRLCRLPVKWYVQLFTSARDKNVRPTLLASMVHLYITNALKQDGHSPDETTDADKDNFQDAGEDGPENIADEVEEENPNTSHDKEEREKDEHEECKHEKVDIREMFDKLIPEVPDTVPVEEFLSPQWALKLISRADELGCKCREWLIKLASRLLHRFEARDLAIMTPDLLCEIVSAACADAQNPRPDVVCLVVDGFLSELAAKQQLTVELFTRMVDAVPQQYRDNHDTLFQVLDTLLKSDELKPTAEEKEKLVAAVDFKRLSESTLQQASESDQVPSNYVTKAALALCTKLRSELDNARAIIVTQEEELSLHGLGSKVAPHVHWSRCLPGSNKSPQTTHMTSRTSQLDSVANLSSEREFRFAMEELGRVYSRAPNESPSSYHSYRYNNYLEDRDPIPDCNHTYRSSSATRRPIRLVYNPKSLPPRY